MFYFIYLKVPVENKKNVCVTIIKDTTQEREKKRFRAH